MIQDLFFLANFSSPRTDGTVAATGLRRLFQWAMTLRESWSFHRRRTGTKEVEIYKLRRQQKTAAWMSRWKLVNGW